VQTLTVPVTVGKLGTAMTFDGAFAISRKLFGIGSPDWNDVVDDQVRVRFHLVE
jgi:YceI-like domain